MWSSDTCGLNIDHNLLLMDGHYIAFTNLLAVDRSTSWPMASSARESLESHLMAFAAEASRHNQMVINMRDFRDEAEKQALNHSL